MPKKKPARSPKAKASKKPAPRRVGPKTPAKEAPRGALPIEIDPKRVEETLKKVKDELVHWANKGRYTRVRFRFRGKQLLPDIPLAAFVAAEGLTFYWGGILRALIVNLAGRTVFDVELVNDSEKRILKGKEELLSGDLDRALACFKEALAMDRDNPNVHLNLGIAYKLKGDVGGAREAFERAMKLDKDGGVLAEAERLLSQLPQPNQPVAITPFR